MIKSSKETGDGLHRLLWKARSKREALAFVRHDLGNDSPPKPSNIVNLEAYRRAA